MGDAPPPPDAEGYLRSRVPIYAKMYNRRYRSLRAQHPVHLVAHNSSGFNSCALLDHFCEMGRLSVERSALVERARVEGRAWDGEVALLIKQGDGTSVLDVGNSRYLDVKYKGMFIFRDSCKQLAKSLEACGRAFKVQTRKWATFPHKYLQREGVRFEDRELEYTPHRSDFVLNSAPRGPLKHQTKQLLSVEEYTRLGGKCPDDPLLDGPKGSTYNIYRECVEYCLDDCQCLHECWAEWRTAIVRLTSDDGCQLQHSKLFAGACTVVSIDPGVENCDVSVVRQEESGERRVLHWTLLHSIGKDGGAEMRRHVDRLARPSFFEEPIPHIDAVLVEQAGEDNHSTLALIRSIMEAFPSVHRIDAGYRLHLDPDRDIFPTPTHGEQKAWAVRFLARLLEGVDHPPPTSDSKRDDVADSVLQAWWWLDTHRASKGEAVAERCQCCLKRFHTHGVDPNSMLTTGQLTMTVCKTELTCDEMQLVDGEWECRKHYTLRFLPASTLPQSYDALADELGVGRREKTAAVEKIPWGRVRHSSQLRAVVKALASQDELQLDPVQSYEQAVAGLEAHDAKTIPVLDRAMDTFVRKSVFGGRTEPFENMFEPTYNGKQWRGEDGWNKVEQPTSLGALLERGATEFEADGFEWDILLLDLVSQYPTELMGDLPCGEGQWLTQSELDKLTADPAAFDQFYGFLKVDVEVNKTHPVWARYPFLPERRMVNGSEKLMWTCTDKICSAGVEHVYFSEELKKAVKCGNVVLKVHQALRFEKSAYLKQFIDVFRAKKEQIDRLKGTPPFNEAMRQGVKDILNTLYGKTLERIRKTEVAIVD